MFMDMKDAVEVGVRLVYDQANAVRGCAMQESDLPSEPADERMAGKALRSAVTPNG